MSSRLRSVALDLSTDAGRQVFRDLARQSDAVYSNLRGDVPHKLGLTYPQLAEVNPRIVCCSLSGFGTKGPRHAEPGYDYIIQGLTGWMDVTGEPDGPPTKSGPSVVDWSIERRPSRRSTSRLSPTCVTCSRRENARKPLVPLIVWIVLKMLLSSSRDPGVLSSATRSWSSWSRFS